MTMKTELGLPYQVSDEEFKKNVELLRQQCEDSDEGSLLAWAVLELEALRYGVDNLAKLVHREHFWLDDDNWYSCPKAPDGCNDDDAGDECRCGADKHNAKADKILWELGMNVG